MSTKRDINILNKIIPNNCEAYLKNKGWHHCGNINSVAKIYEHQKDEKLFSVIVPMTVEISDYKNRIRDLLSVLDEFEDRDWQYIAKDIILSNYDTFRITAFKGDVETSLPLSDAATMLKSSQDMMAAVAQSIIKARPYFQSKRSNEVNDFLSKLRMGHTEKGSFIMTIQTPIAPTFINEPLFQETDDNFLLLEEPFERQVTSRLCSLVSEAENIANTPSEEMLMKSVSAGMSANFFTALADIVDICGEKGAYLDMTWASVRPITSKKHTKSNFFVKKEMVSTLKEAGRILKNKIPEEDIEVAGYVIALHKEKDAEKGTIKLHDISTETPRIISIELNKKDYKQAIEAHKEGKFVTFKGNLQKKARTRTFTDVSSMKVSNSENF